MIFFLTRWIDDLKKQWCMPCLKQLILDFLEEVVRRPTVLVGNSVGSLACVIAASGSNQPTPVNSLSANYY
jgi:hypothetical protein